MRLIIIMLAVLLLVMGGACKGKEEGGQRMGTQKEQVTQTPAPTSSPVPGTEAPKAGGPISGQSGQQ